MEFVYRNDGPEGYHLYNTKLDYWLSDSVVCSELERLGKIDASANKKQSFLENIVTLLKGGDATT